MNHYNSEISNSENISFPVIGPEDNKVVLHFSSGEIMLFPVGGNNDLDWSEDDE